MNIYRSLNQSNEDSGGRDGAALQYRLEMSFASILSNFYFSLVLARWSFSL